MAAGARRVDLSKLMFVTLLWAGVLGATFYAGIRAGVDRNEAFRLTRALRTKVQGSLSVTLGEFSNLFRVRPIHFLQPSQHRGAGVTVNVPANDQDDLILLTGFFAGGNELRLIRRDGYIVARWPVRFYDVFSNADHFPPGWEPATNWNIDLHGALALPDGSVVFNFEWGGLVKLDRCGRVVWKIQRQTHHAVERAEGGGFWVPGRRLVQGPTPHPPFETPFHEDTILRVSDEGRVVAEYSSVKVFYDAGLEAVLTASGSAFENGMEWDHEVVHLNKVEELTEDVAADFPMFEAGDLALSSRDLNLVMVVDSQVSTVKWWRIGPWIRQHDPEFKRGGTIVLVNNNVHQTAFGKGNLKVSPGAPKVTNIMEIAPASGETRIVYGGRPGQELLTVIKGKVDVTEKGGLLITESQSGRVLEVDPQGRIVWEYVNRYEADEVAEINEARLYPSSYFDVENWSCDPALLTERPTTRR